MSQPPPQQQPQKKASRGRKLLLVAIATFASLLALEGAIRVRQYLKYGTFDRLASLATHPSGLRMPVPNSTQHGVRIDSQGFRSPELDSPKPEGRVRVGFLGGSTTYCAEATSNEATWPHLVVEKLRAGHPKADIDYLNGAVVGFASDHSRQNLEHRVAQCDPDVLVIYHGTNDVAKYTRALAQERGVWKEGEGKESWLERASLAWRLIVRNLAIQQRAQTEETTRTLDFSASEITPEFRNSLTALVRESKKVADAVVLITFAPRIRREHDPEQRMAASNTSLYYMPYMTPDSMLESFSAFNDVVREVARAEGAVLVDAEGEIPSDGEHFNDSVHLRDPGCARMAELVADAMLAAPSVRSLLTNRK